MKSLSCVRVVSTNYRVLICCTCHFQGGSFGFIFCLLVSSVFDFRPDTRGRWWTLFFWGGGRCSLVQSRCGEGGTLQTNNTGMCLQCLSHTGLAPAHGACTLPAHTARALGCSAGNNPRLALGCNAPPRSKPLRFRHSGSPQRRRLGWACVLCPSQVRAAQVMRCLASAIAATSCLPAAQLSRCTTGAPS